MQRSTEPGDAARLPGLTGVSADSRRIGPGMVFVALAGTQADGRAFIADAVARGAIAVLAAPGTILPAGIAVPLLIDANPRRALARLATELAGPQPDHIVAVTGTNGKTSTAEFTRQLWAAAGRRAASLGTLGLIAPDAAAGSGLTTPDPVELASIMAGLARDGVADVAVEASSHGLDQNRLDGLRLAAGAFTNLTRDHLDYHRDMTAYRAAKLRLFGELLPPGAPAFASGSLDGETFAALAAIAAARGLKLQRVGVGGDDIRLLRATALPDGQALELRVDGGLCSLHLPLAGLFQADNALLAAGLARATGVANAIDLLPGLDGVRGRMELAARLPNQAAVYVDFAHTPDALARLLMALRLHSAGRLSVVIGAGGDRDPGKRPLMGAAAAQYADAVIVTDDNPRSENPAAIRAAVLAGCPGGREIGDRAAAIAAGLNDLGPGDVLVVAGKGHEQGQQIGGHTLPFDDVGVIRHLVGLA